MASWLCSQIYSQEVVVGMGRLSRCSSGKIAKVMVSGFRSRSCLHPTLQQPSDPRGGSPDQAFEASQATRNNQSAMLSCGSMRDLT